MFVGATFSAARTRYSRPHISLKNTVREPCHVLTKYFTTCHDHLQYGAHCNQLTKILEDFSHTFNAITNVLLVSLPYDTLNMFTRLTETCRYNTHKCIAEHLRNYVFVDFLKKINSPKCTVWNTQSLLNLN